MTSKELNRTRPRRRLLVVANETAEASVLHRVIVARARAAPPADVMVVAPAPNSRVRHRVSDEDEAGRSAERRLRACLNGLESAGIEANGMVGDADPLQAIEDALHWFRADEFIIATCPERRSHWLARNLVRHARARYSVPILHVVIDEDRRTPLDRSPRTLAAA
jgi:hypothetical protein